MKILQLAPHPFYVDRGTPIDVLLVLRVLCHRPNTKVDILVYHEGEDVDLPNLNIYRTMAHKFFEGMRPGFSFKKILCDILMFFKAWKLVHKNRYDFIHAGEETVFFAMFFKLLYKIPYAYDLDSSIAQQMVEKKSFLKKVSGFFDWCEAKAIQKSTATFPVCNALGEICKKNNSPYSVVLHDISQLQNPNADKTFKLHDELNIDHDRLLIVYIGNLEVYQGVDLLVESFAKASADMPSADLVIIGGVDEDIEAYKQKAKDLGVEGRVYLAGKRPFAELDSYLAEADILACPRIRGVNTPMKIFPYMHSGKAVIATDLYTHNQLLTENERCLAGADNESFAQAMIKLVNDEEYRNKLGKQGKAFVEKNHVFSAHEKRLNEAYDQINISIT